MKIEILKDKKRDRLVNHLESRYGIKTKEMKDYELIVTGKGKVWMVNKDCLPLLKENLNLHGIGISLFLREKDFKPTTYAIRFFGEKIRENIIEINEEELDLFFKGEEFEVSVNNIQSTGYVALKYKDLIIGSGKYLKEENKIKPNVAVKRKEFYR